MRDYRSARKSKKKKFTNKNSNLSRVWKWLLALISTMIVIMGGVYILSLNISVLFPLKTVKTVILTSSDTTDTNRMYLVSFIPKVEQISVHELDPSKMTNVLGGYGEYKLSALYGLLDIENKSPEYLRAAYSLATGQIIDAVVVADVSEIEKKEDLENILFSSLYNKFPQDNDQNIPLGELLEIFAYTREPVNKMILGSSRVNPLVSYVSQESGTCSVAVINPTNISGLATRVGEVLANSGLSIVRTDGDINDESETSVIYVDSEQPECAVWAEYAGIVLPGDVEVINTDDEKIFYYRASIVLVLGTDME